MAGWQLLLKKKNKKKQNRFSHPVMRYPVQITCLAYIIINFCVVLEIFISKKKKKIIPCCKVPFCSHYSAVSILCTLNRVWELLSVWDSTHLTLLAMTLELQFVIVQYFSVFFLVTYTLLGLSTSSQDVLNSSDVCASPRHLDKPGTSWLTIAGGLSTGAPAQTQVQRSHS